MADGAGVAIGEGDVVGVTVGCGVLGLAAGLVDVVGLGVVAGGDVGDTFLAGAVRCGVAGTVRRGVAGESVAAARGLNRM